MIDMASEKVFPLADGPKHLPRRRGNRAVHPATFFRWAQRGLRGIRLETLQVGGTKCTSVDAIQRFFERLGAAADGTAPAPGTTKQRQAAAGRANDELAKAGW